uniref:ATP synthase complex subunit 8 n=1 Tax=Eurythenes magellanicus TaxID=1813117 RepID=A0A650B706_9CRUS|nr:ATP synthase F0 subunit 8 [Eurythenes magellanicus]
MPQMAPTLWLPLFTFLLSLFFLTKTLLYFYMLTDHPSAQPTLSPISSTNWKW